MALSSIKTILTSMTTTITGYKKPRIVSSKDLQTNKWYRFSKHNKDIEVTWSVHAKPTTQSGYISFPIPQTSIFMFIRHAEDLDDNDRPHTEWLHVGVEDVFGYALVYKDLDFEEVTEEQ